MRGWRRKRPKGTCLLAPASLTGGTGFRCLQEYSAFSCMPWLPLLLQLSLGRLLVGRALLAIRHSGAAAKNFAPCVARRAAFLRVSPPVKHSASGWYAWRASGSGGFCCASSWRDRAYGKSAQRIMAVEKATPPLFASLPAALTSPTSAASRPPKSSLLTTTLLAALRQDSEPVAAARAGRARVAAAPRGSAADLRRWHASTYPPLTPQLCAFGVLALRLAKARSCRCLCHIRSGV